MARTCWQYILKALGWARKYGLRVKIDLHTIPGSQNGELPFHIEFHRKRDATYPDCTTGSNKSLDRHLLLVR